MNEAHHDLDASRKSDVGKRPPQFSSAFLLLVMLVTAIGAAGVARLLAAWELPRRRPLFVFVTVAAPTLLVCAISVGIQLIRRFIR